MSDETSESFPETAQAGGGVPTSGLVLVSTPIGNLGDFTDRAREVLARAHLVLCEDTRRTIRLLAHFGITARLEALHDHNEAARLPRVMEELAAGRLVALVSDAGTPVVSDPGYRLVRAALAAGIAVSAIPGPNAAVMALVLSGLPPQPFLFLGFLPPRRAARRSALAQVRAAEQAGLRPTLVLYEAPHRLAETLSDLADMLGDRPAAIARELTKRFEEVRRDGLAALAAAYETTPARGEITIVVGPETGDEAVDVDVDQLLRDALTTQSLKQAVASVAAATGLPRRTVYARALALASEHERGEQ